MLNDVEDGKFAPQASLTRATMLTILYNYEKPEGAYGESGFADVAAEKWYGDSVAWAAENGLVSGYNENFRLDDAITRQEAAVILFRFAKYMDKGPVEDWAIRIDYVDVAEISDWAYEAIMWATMKGITSGRPDKTLDPTGIATRAEVATMLTKFIENVQ